MLIQRARQWRSHKVSAAWRQQKDTGCGKVYSFIVHGTYVDTQMQLVTSVKGSTSKTIKPKSKRDVPDGFIQWQTGALTRLLAISAIKCSLDECQLPSPPSLFDSKQRDSYSFSCEFCLSHGCQEPDSCTLWVCRGSESPLTQREPAGPWGLHNPTSHRAKQLPVASPQLIKKTPPS